MFWVRTPGGSAIQRINIRKAQKNPTVELNHPFWVPSPNSAIVWDRADQAIIYCCYYYVNIFYRKWKCCTTISFFLPSIVPSFLLSFIHLFIFSNHVILLRITMYLESIPGTLDVRREYTSDQTPVNHRSPSTHTFTHSFTLWGNLVSI